MNLVLENLECLQTTEKYKPVFLTGKRVIHILILFNLNGLFYKNKSKSLDIDLNKSASKSTDSEQFKKDTPEKFNNGKFSISTRRMEPRTIILHRQRNNGSSTKRDNKSRKKARFI